MHFFPRLVDSARRGSRLATRLARDCRGDVYSMSVVLLTTLIAIGGIVGLTTLRDQIVQELGDFAASITHLDQSYSSSCGIYEDDAPLFDDPAGAAPAGLDLNP